MHIRSGGRAPFLWVLAVAAVYLFLLAAYKDLTPFYDGGIYYASIQRLVTLPFSWVLLHMEGHVSPVYTMLISWSQFIDQGAAFPMFATNFALMLFAAVMMYKLLSMLFGSVSRPLELMLGASIYGAMPVLVTHAFHINLDFGLSIFLVPYLYFLLGGKHWRAAVCAIAMMMTKETGVLIYLVIASLYIFLYITRPAGSFKNAINAFMHHYALIVPAAVFSIYYGAFRFFAPQSQAHWGQNSVDSNVMHTLLDFNLADSGIRSFLSNIFIINFNWLLTLTLIAFLLHRAWRWMFGLQANPLHSIQKRDLIFLILAFIGLIYITTRIRYWNNPRYVLAVFPVFIPLAFYCLMDLVRTPRIRASLLGITLGLVMIANVTTIDPVSRAVYGTITFGTHPWLNMTSMIGPLWLRRDQQAYNLEFLELHYATDMAWKDIEPPPGAVVLGGPMADFYVSNRIETGTFHPTLRLDGSQPLRILDQLEQMKPEKLIPQIGEQPFIWFMGFPNLDNAQFLPQLSQDYTLLSEKKYGRRGYTVDVLTYERP